MSVVVVEQKPLSKLLGKEVPEVAGALVVTTRNAVNEFLRKFNCVRIKGAIRPVYICGGFRVTLVPRGNLVIIIFADIDELTNKVIQEIKKKQQQV